MAKQSKLLNIKELKSNIYFSLKVLFNSRNECMRKAVMEGLFNENTNNNVKIKKIKKSSIQYPNK